MQKKGMKTFTLVLFLVVLGVLGYYIHLTNGAPGHEDVTPSSEKDILLQYDMVADYPKTVRETVKLHCRYLKYTYNTGLTKECSEDDVFVLNQKMRQLFDDELLDLNTPEKQLEALKKDILLYQSNKQKFVSYTLAEPSQIEYNTEGDTEYAKMTVNVAMTMDGASFAMDEEYILRKNQEGQWKILGWMVVGQDKQNVEEEEK
ncbi:MAG: hypothetical protein E7264_10925 [Lachnospiraceae bacterium]|nr:hypothetical protein [Lachnospiraceae bacterium]